MKRVWAGELAQARGCPTLNFHAKLIALLQPLRMEDPRL